MPRLRDGHSGGGVYVIRIRSDPRRLAGGIRTLAVILVAATSYCLHLKQYPCSSYGAPQRVRYVEPAQGPWITL